MKDNTLRGELNKIAQELLEEYDYDNYTVYKPEITTERRTEAVDQLEALLAEEVRKARIEEVNRISRYVEIRNTADGATISAEYLYRQARKRIKQLEKEDK